MHQRDPFQDDVDFQFGALITVLCPRPVGDDVIPSAAADARFGPAADAASFSPPYTGPRLSSGVVSSKEKRAVTPRRERRARADKTSILVIRADGCTSRRSPLCQLPDLNVARRLRCVARGGAEKIGRCHRQAGRPVAGGGRPARAPVQLFTELRVPPARRVCAHAATPLCRSPLQRDTAVGGVPPRRHRRHRCGPISAICRTCRWRGIVEGTRHQTPPSPLHPRTAGHAPSRRR